MLLENLSLGSNSQIEYKDKLATAYKVIGSRGEKVLGKCISLLRRFIKNKLDYVPSKGHSSVPN